MKEILVGVDASDVSVDALRFAARLASETGAALTVVHVRAAPYPLAEGFGAGELQLWLKTIEQDALERVTEALVGTACRWTFEVRDGDPADQLERAGHKHGAELIVVGGRGHTVVHRLLLGSVSNRLVHHADRPVLVVR